jgi:hypothetical protein
MANATAAQERVCAKRTPSGLTPVASFGKAVIRAGSLITVLTVDVRLSQTPHYLSTHFILDAVTTPPVF